MLRTRHREYLLMMACIEAKQRFVSDNTNATRDIRARTIQLAKPAGFQIVGYYFRSTLVEAIARNAQRLGEERIPEAGIRTMFGRLELPSFAEGFDKLFYVSISQDNRFIVDRWHDEIR
jgi:predicted kinase